MLWEITTVFLIIVLLDECESVSFIVIFRLDPALIRPGRVDCKEKIDHCTEHQIDTMYSRFFPDEAEHRSMDFAKKVSSHGKNVSAAQIQGFFMFYKNDAQGAIDNADRIWTI